MSRRHDRERAITLRKEGKSYSEIKSDLGVSKSTLIVWLRNLPLNADQMQNIREIKYRQIEKYRETMQRKRQVRLDAAYEKVKKDIGSMSKRDKIIGGLHLYWAEGTKSARGRTEVANTDPALIKAFLEWRSS